MGTYRQFTSVQLELVGVDLTASADIEYETVPVDLRKFRELTIYVTWGITGGAAGAMSVLYQRNSGDSSIAPQIVLATALDTSATGTCMIEIPYGRAPLITTDGTLGTELAGIRPFGWAKFGLRINTSSDGDPAFGNMSIFAR